MLVPVSVQCCHKHMEQDRQTGREIITKIAVVTYISFPLCLRCVVQMFMNQYRLVVCCVHLKTLRTTRAVRGRYITPIHSDV